MINKEKLKPIIEEYKNSFLENWDKEKFKWEAVKHFKEHWDINADNFGEMFEEATSKANNLLGSRHSYPRTMIINFANADDEATRKMFLNLYNESQDLESRIEAFKAQADEIRNKYGAETWNSHYQNINSISTYLWLRFPDKYYIYKYDLYRNMAQELSASYSIKRDGAVRNVIDGYQMYDEVRQELISDESLYSLVNDTLASYGYSDPEMITTTIDFGYYLNQFFHKDQKIKKEDSLTGDTQKTEELDDQNYWWVNANPKYWSFSKLKVGEERYYTFYNENGNKRHIFQNFIDAKVGDIVIGYDASPYKKIVAICLVSRKDEGKAIYFKKIEDLDHPIDYSALKDSHELGNMICKNGSLFKLSRSQYDFIMDLIREKNPQKSFNEIIPKYSDKDFLNEVFISKERLETLKALLRNKKNIILQGAPGVGKTFMAKRLAYTMMGELDDSRIELIQFHQSYSYEDFIMGYHPDGSDFKLTEGIFYRFCKKALDNPDRDYFFIIDEINRGNLSKIFGELLMLIEKDYRGVEATLAYTGEPFFVPENLYIIGMMNTADRSLALIDYALRRRFSFYKIGPGFNSEGFIDYQNGLSNPTFNALVKKIEELNKDIIDDKSLGRGFQIGHSYFCNLNKEECTEDRIHSIIEFDIIPTLEEYWFDEPEKLERWENNLWSIFDDEG